jgi:hypothetical protein
MPLGDQDVGSSVKHSLVYGIMSFASPVSFWLADRYVDQYDGWGQWAAAPTLLIPLLFALGVTLAGVVSTFVLVRKNASPLAMITLTLVAATPIIYTLIR